MTTCNFVSSNSKKIYHYIVLTYDLLYSLMLIKKRLHLHFICDHYAVEYSILFNAKNSKYISFGSCYGYSSRKKIYQYTVFLIWVILLVIPATIDLT